MDELKNCNHKIHLMLLYQTQEIQGLSKCSMHGLEQHKVIKQAFFHSLEGMLVSWIGAG